MAKHKYDIWAKGNSKKSMKYSATRCDLNTWYQKEYLTLARVKNFTLYTCEECGS